MHHDVLIYLKYKRIVILINRVINEVVTENLYLFDDVGMDKYILI